MQLYLSTLQSAEPLSSEHPCEKLPTNFPRRCNRDWQKKFITVPTSASHQFTADKGYAGKLVFPSTKTMWSVAFRNDERCSFCNRPWLGSCKIQIPFVKSKHLRSVLALPKLPQYMLVDKAGLPLPQFHVWNAQLWLSTPITGPDELGCLRISVHHCVNSSSALQIQFRHADAALESLPVPLEPVTGHFHYHNQFMPQIINE